MTPYAIFAIVLTIAYIIYYGYNISKDIYGKIGENTDSEGTFDIGAISDEVIATPVREMNGGFALGDSEVTGIVKEDTLSETSSENTDKYASLKDELEDADIQSEGGLREPDMQEWMILNNVNPSDVLRKSKITEIRGTV